MAATVTSPWGTKPGNGHGSSSVAAEPLSDFPDLMTANANKTKKKKKGQTLSLGEFVNGTTYQAVKGLTVDEMMVLPTGPRQKTGEEVGGGFRSYGGGGGGDWKNESSSSRWGSRNRKPLGLSRADEIDDWNAAKKSSTGHSTDEIDDRNVAKKSSTGHSNEIDDWNAAKKSSTGRSTDGIDDWNAAKKSSTGRSTDEIDDWSAAKKSSSTGHSTESWVTNKSDSDSKCGLRSCLAASGKKDGTRLKKKVAFADDVVEPSGNGEEYRRKAKEENLLSSYEKWCSG